MSAVYDGPVRLVTHLDISRQDIEQALRAFARLLGA